MVTNFRKTELTSHKRPKIFITKFKCKKHGEVNFQYDKLLNIAGKKFCPHCLAEFFMVNGICILEKSKEITYINKPQKNNKSNNNNNGRW